MNLKLEAYPDLAGKGMGALRRIVERTEAHEVFERKRTGNETRATRMLLCRSSLSYGKTRECLGVSRTAMWDWYHTGRGLFASQKVRVHRKRISIDEKEVSMGGMPYYIWAAADLDG